MEIQVLGQLVEGGSLTVFGSDEPRAGCASPGMWQAVCGGPVPVLHWRLGGCQDLS